MRGAEVEAVQREVARIVVAMAPRAVAQPEPSARLAEDLGYDSLRLVELGIALEERFGVEIDESESFDAETLADVEQLAARLLAQLVD